MKALNIIESAYRGTLEEQDDTVVWITHALKGAGAELDVLLKGNAVNYAVASQHVPSLAFGERVQSHGPHLADDVAGLIGKGITVHIIQEDLDARGIQAGELIDGLTPVARGDLPNLFQGYDHIWHW